MRVAAKKTGVIPDETRPNPEKKQGRLILESDFLEDKEVVVGGHVLDSDQS